MQPQPRLLYSIFFCLCLLSLSMSKPFAQGEGTLVKAEQPSKEWQWLARKSVVNDQGLWLDQESFAFSDSWKWQTNAVVIIKDDKIVYEKYRAGFEGEKGQRLWSVSKSVTSALVGIRWHQLSWSLQRPVYHLVEELNTPLKQKITMTHLLQMSSGLAFNEFYESNPFQSHVVDMLYINGHRDMGSFTAKRRMRSRPGERFNYSSGETNLIMKALKATFNKASDYQEFPWKFLFEPLGIKSATWEQDLSGVFVGSSYLFMSPYDLARFGRVYLNNGAWTAGGETTQILPTQFIKESLKRSPAVCRNLQRGKRDRYTYGMHWWLNKECPNKNKRTHPQLPQEAYMALGHHGQMLVIIPQERAIVVRLGSDKKKRFPRDKWLSKVYNALKEIPPQTQRGESL